jgi:N-acetyl sugar amidotransferase
MKDHVIDWTARYNELREVLEGHRSKDGTNYDCLIPVSGGKDSTFQTYLLKHEFGLKPLCVCWHPCERTELGQKNIENLSRMGVDLIEIKGNPRVYHRLAREALIRVGDLEWPEHVGIFTAPVRVAVRYRIPLIVWGENSQLEYGGGEIQKGGAPARASNVLDRRWLEEFGGLLGLRVEDMVGVDGITYQDLLPYTYPSDEELAAAGVSGLFLGYYIKWDARQQLQIVREHGFQVADGPMEGTYTNYENLDCKFMALHDYLKWLKYGFGRATDHVGLDIRNHRMTREEGLGLVRQHEGRLPRRYLPDILRALEMTEDELMRELDKWTNKALFLCDEQGVLVRDVDGDLIKRAYDNDR